MTMKGAEGWKHRLMATDWKQRLGDRQLLLDILNRVLSLLSTAAVEIQAADWPASQSRIAESHPTNTLLKTLYYEKTGGRNCATMAAQCFLLRL
jgi:hypothetical protein